MLRQGAKPPRRPVQGDSPRPCRRGPQQARGRGWNPTASGRDEACFWVEVRRRAPKTQSEFCVFAFFAKSLKWPYHAGITHERYG